MKESRAARRNESRMEDFVHLHLHSEYSLLDGAVRLAELPQRLAEVGQSRVALTDHGVLYGAVEFYQTCRQAGIHPILGLEAYVAAGSRLRHEGRDRPYHLTLLAQDETGWRNLMQLASAAFLEGFHYKPRIDMELLATHNEGLICLSGCPTGELSRLLEQGQAEAALAAARRHLEIFGPTRYAIELQDHGLPVERRVLRGLVEIADRLGVPVVATNDVHYLRQEDASLHDLLLCIQTGKTLVDPTRLRFPNDEFYLKSAAAMRQRFADLPEALRNTCVIAERCHVNLEFGRLLLPAFPVPEGESAASFLRALCRRGLAERYGQAPPSVHDRLQHELDVIFRMGFADYFLIVWDFVRFARAHGIAVGPGRGSAASSLVAYLLHITDVDPLQYNLFFERFLNPERVTMPDMDIDFDYERRDEVIAYVVEKYGGDHVAQIITFGTLGARAAVRDVGRVLGLPYALVDRVAKQLPAGPEASLAHALEDANLQALVHEDAQVARVLNLAARLEGAPRHASVHAAGVVISKDPLVQHVPLAKLSEGPVITQFSMGHLEQLGLLKMDFLGLRTLTVLDEARRHVAQLEGLQLDLTRLKPDDAATFAMLARGETEGVFQLESPGMKEMLKELKPGHLEDVIAAVALYRPGPMEQIPTFLRNKQAGRWEVLHPLLAPIVAPTYGVLVYQEQILQIAAVVAGFTPGQADILRRGVGKKKRELLDEMRAAFVAGCVAQGHPEALGAAVYDLIERFADYGFARAHAVPYGLLAYQTAYLKANHPRAYLAALLTSVMGNADKVAEYLAECRRLGIAVLPPDVNESGPTFTPTAAGIRFGLAAVKHVGAGVAAYVAHERQATGPYDSLTHFCARTTGHLNRRAIESLIKAGALDHLAGVSAPGREALSLAAQARPRLLQGLDQALALAAVDRDQATLFDWAGAEGGAPSPLPAVPPWSTSEVLASEREALGFYVSAHPLEPLAALLANKTHPLVRLGELPEGAAVTVGGVVRGHRTVQTRRGEVMAFVELEDLSGVGELVVFPRVFAAAQGLLTEQATLLASGRVGTREGQQAHVLVDRLESLAESASHTASRPPGLYVRVDPTPENLRRLRAILTRYPGQLPVYLVKAGSRRVRRADATLWVTPVTGLLEELANWLGPGTISLEGP